MGSCWFLNHYRTVTVGWQNDVDVDYDGDEIDDVDIGGLSCENIHDEEHHDEEIHEEEIHNIEIHEDIHDLDFLDDLIFL